MALSEYLNFIHFFTSYSKFIFSKKTTKFDKIFIDDLMVTIYCQIDDEGFVNFRGFFRKRELYYKSWYQNDQNFKKYISKKQFQKLRIQKSFQSIVACLDQVCCFQTKLLRYLMIAQLSLIFFYRSKFYHFDVKTVDSAII